MDSIIVVKGAIKVQINKFKILN